MIFQFTSKKIISLLACISITISCLVIPASAAVTSGQVIEGIGTIATFWDIGKDVYEMWQELNPDKDPSEYPGFNPGGSFSGAGGSRDDAIARYDSYVTDLETDLGTTTLIDGGIRLYWKPGYSAMSFSPVTGTGTGSFSTDEITTYIHVESKCSRLFISSTVNVDNTWIAPFTCTYQYGMESNYGQLTGSTRPWEASFSGSGSVTVGDKEWFFSSPSWNFYNPDYSTTAVVSNLAIRYFVDIYPVEGATLPISHDITINSRPTTLVGDYGIIGDDGSIIKVDGNLIVDESTNTVYNPVTNTTYNYTDYVYDYSDRSYNLTLEDGSTMKVVYGDENITINEGDTVYNVYYLIQDPAGSGDSGGGGSGSGDSSGGDGGILGDAVGGFLGALGDVISGLISGLLSLATKALEALTGLGDLLKQLGESLIGFFSGFTDFLGAVFPFLPEETFTILNLGLILMIAAAVFKKFF